MSAPVIPPHLAGQVARGLVPDAKPTVAQYEIGELKNFIYVILDWATHEAAIIDPQRDLRPVDDLERNGFRLNSVLLTHSHHDHVAGLAPLRARLPELPIYLHHADHHRIASAFPAGPQLRFLEDGAEFSIGKLRAQAFHTPGHSAGALTYLLQGPAPGERYLFTGDTVFIRDCGRTDFATGSNEAMFYSLQRYRQWPGEAVLLPGHHYAPEVASTLAREWATSPPFQCRSIDELARLP